MLKLRFQSALIAIIIVMFMAACHEALPQYSQLPLAPCPQFDADVVPGAYTVILGHERTISQHQQDIGQCNLKEQHIRRVIRSVYGGTETYFTKPITMDVLRKIRSDVNVKHISCTALTRASGLGKSGLGDGGKVHFTTEQAHLSGLSLDKELAIGFDREMVRQNWNFVSSGPWWSTEPQFSGLLGGAQTVSSNHSSVVDCVRSCLDSA